ncbi:MAG TPA: ABC transporter ATP-binding protein [Chloroflexi bacterium]|nr:ABC transporter ATP-binding protein [Chloroflexota bacterium]
MASITLEKLWKKYGDVEAVRGISVDIVDGEFMSLLGPSGCGKSSTMRMIAGLEEITSGNIYFDGELINKVRPRDRNVAMAFETYALYPTLNVYENLAFPLRAARWSNADVDKRVQEIAGILEITDLLDRMPAHLSGGQQQLVGLARALTRAPRVFLMDEPISHLDTRQRGRMRAYLKRLHIELGHTMIYVTHDQEEAMALADRVAVMDQGLIRQVGTPDEIFHNPADRFVAGFIGEPPMNFLECEYSQEEGRHVLRHNSITIEMPPHSESWAQRGAIPQHVTLGIRPFYIDTGLEKSVRHTIPAEVFVVEPLGDMTVVSVNVLETRLQIVTEPDFRAQRKQSLWLAFDPARTLLFDAETGKALANQAWNQERAAGGTGDIKAS